MKREKLIISIIRYILAFILLVFGLNGFMGFLPMPESPEAASDFLKALEDTAYMFPLLYGSELVIAFLLLFKKTVPLALILFSPIVINILFYHLFLDPAGGVAGYFTTALTLVMVVYYYSRFKPILQENGNV
jgi:uncharacterized membrane protein YphA (DoxX/SURF4 family)